MPPDDDGLSERGAQTKISEMLAGRDPAVAKLLSDAPADGSVPAAVAPVVTEPTPAATSARQLPPETPGRAAEEAARAAEREARSKLGAHQSGRIAEAWEAAYLDAYRVEVDRLSATLTKLLA